MILKILSLFLNLDEPHFGSGSDALRNAVRSYLENGGNSIVQCAGIEQYENDPTGYFLTQQGINDDGPGSGTFEYHFSTPIMQYNGAVNSDVGGSTPDWTAIGATAGNSQLQASTITYLALTDMTDGDLQDTFKLQGRRSKWSFFLNLLSFGSHHRNIYNRTVESLSDAYA